MNEMRKLIEAVEQLDDGVSQDRRDEYSAQALEYAAFVYGVEWGNEAQYGDGGYDSETLPAEFKDWIDGGRKGLHEETTDIQYPDYDDLQDRVDVLRDALEEIETYAESKYREGDYGYQFAILAREALKRA